MADVVFKVMVSSSFRDLKAFRRETRDAIQGQGMLPLMMEVSPAMGDRGIIENSLAMVDEADAYVVLISNYRYGQVIKDAIRNPKNLSVTELEFNRAEGRKLPIYAFLMDESVRVAPAEIRKESRLQRKLDAFRKRANHHCRVTDTFTSTARLKGKVTQAMARLKAILEAQQTPGPGPAAPDSASPFVAPAPATSLDATLLPAPPAFVARPPYVPGHPFQGRARELALLRDWATESTDPVLVFEAIGGMGTALGEPEPQLPPFDPAKVQPLDYEPAIRRLLEEHAAKSGAASKRLDESAP